MNDRSAIGRQALRGALQTRRKIRVPKTAPIAAVDFALRLGLDVWFKGGKSFSGMYSKTTGTILVPSLRPIGYQSITCAHELGHWYFAHGSRVDSMGAVNLEGNDDPEERLANLYAAYLLMPSWAVQASFDRRGWIPTSCTPFQAYVVAGQLGVGYSALVQHLRWSLNRIESDHAAQLLKATPKQIRETILGRNCARHMVIADEVWTDIAVDLQVGDFAILPTHVILEGRSVTVVDNHELGMVVEARIPGITRVESTKTDWATFVRVSAREYSGHAEYRHWEDPDVDESSESNSQRELVPCVGDGILGDDGPEPE